MKTTIDTLHHLPELAAEVWLTREAKNPGGDNPHTAKPKPASRPPTDLAVLDALRPDTKGLLARLSTCVRGVVEHAGWDAVPDLEETPTWVSETEWLLATVSIWQDDEWLTDYVTHEVECVRKDLAALARVSARRPTPCGKCGAPAHLAHGGKFYFCEMGHENPGPLSLIASFRRRPPMRSIDASRPVEQDGLGISPSTIRWAKAQGMIAPARTEVENGRPVDYWLPWDLVKITYRDLWQAVNDAENTRDNGAA